MDWVKAIEYALILQEAYAVLPGNVVDAAGSQLTIGTNTYTVVSTIYGNDLATDMNPLRCSQIVSIGLICQADATGEVVIAIRGTEGTLEWVHDAAFLFVTCPILAGSGHTEDGFTAMYTSLATGLTPGSPTVVQALATLVFPKPVSSMTICGHSLGGALATLLALDVAANSAFKDAIAYTYASPRTGDPDFVRTYDQVVKQTFRIANRMDLVPKLPFPPLYEHVADVLDLNPIQLFPPKILVRPDLGCEHAMLTYLYLMSLQAVRTVIPLDPTCSA